MLSNPALHRLLSRLQARHSGLRVRLIQEGRHYELRPISAFRRLENVAERLEASKIWSALGWGEFRPSLGLLSLREFAEVIEARNSSGSAGTITVQVNDIDTAVLLGTRFMEGQGLGNQLWAYAVVTSLSQKTKLPFAISGEQFFKGHQLFDLDFGTFTSCDELNPPLKTDQVLIENLERDPKTGLDVSGPDTRILGLEEPALVLGNLQSVSYLAGYETEVRSRIRLRHERLQLHQDLCAVHFRAGDFQGNRLFLRPEYFRTAMRLELELNPKAQFLLVSDQPRVARRLLGSEFQFVDPRELGISPYPRERVAAHHKGKDTVRDFMLLYSARTSIIPNSSYSWWASFLSLPTKNRVWAPMFWAGHNETPPFWSTSDIRTPGFRYISPEGRWEI